MSDRLIIEDQTVPRLVDHVKLRFDKQRDKWLLLAPERVLVPDPVALEVIRRCDGAAPVSAIVDDLARTFNAPRDQILGDVRTLLQDLADKGVMTQ